MEFSIEIKDASLRFNAMHFVGVKSLTGEWRAEPLHGHDFQVEARIESPIGLDVDGCILDFSSLRESLAEVLEGWDGRVLLSSKAPYANYFECDDQELEIEIEFGKGVFQRWRVPQSAVRFLGGAGASTEIIAANIVDEWIENCPIMMNFTVELRLQEAPGSCAVVKCNPCEEQFRETPEYCPGQD